MSIPCKKKVKPIIIRAEPFKKEKIPLLERGVIVICNRNTKIGIGNNEKNTDFSFDLIFFAS